MSIRQSVRSETVWQGRLIGSRIGPSILAAACEAVGIQPDRPGVKLRGFRFVRGPEQIDAWPDVEFDLVLRHS